MSPDGFYKTYTTGNSSKKKIKFEKKYPQDWDGQQPEHQKKR